MKLVHLFKIYWPDNAGGIARAMEIIADSFEEWNRDKISKGFEKSRQDMIVCQPKTGMPSRKEKYKGVPVYRCKMLFSFASTPFSLQLLKTAWKRTKNADVIMYHFPYPLIDLGILLGLFRGKLIVWWHCDFATSRFAPLAGIYRPFVKHTLKKADTIITCAAGNVTGSDTLRSFQDKCIVVPHAVDDTWAEQGRIYFEGRRANKKDFINIIFVGRFVWYKGIDILLQAYKRLETEKDGISLTLAGDGPLLLEMKKLADRLELRNVQFMGAVSNEKKMECIRESDFMVLPSVSEAESFANVQIEAMAFGKPVINTSLHSGVPEVSPDGVSGMTVEPGNADALYKAMKHMAENSELRETYGSEAIRLVWERHRMSKMRQIYKDFFEQLSKTV